MKDTNDNKVENIQEETDNLIENNNNNNKIEVQEKKEDPSIAIKTNEPDKLKEIKEIDDITSDSHTITDKIVKSKKENHDANENKKLQKENNDITIKDSTDSISFEKDQKKNDEPSIAMTSIDEITDFNKTEAIQEDKINNFNKIEQAQENINNLSITEKDLNQIEEFQKENLDNSVKLIDSNKTEKIQEDSHAVSTTNNKVGIV